jgi:hypothetical protein
MLNKMRKTKSKVAPQPSKSDGLIKVWIDDRTTVTVKDKSGFEQWLARFPNAKIIEEKNKK